MIQFHEHRGWTIATGPHLRDGQEVYAYDAQPMGDDARGMDGYGFRSRDEAIAQAKQRIDEREDKCT